MAYLVLALAGLAAIRLVYQAAVDRDARAYARIQAEAGAARRAPEPAATGGGAGAPGAPPPEAAPGTELRDAGPGSP